MNLRIASLITAVAVTAGLSACGQQETAVTVSYAVDIEPLMQQYCAECHIGDHEGVMASGFTVESYETVMKGTKFGPIIVPGSSESSTLYRLAAGEVDPSIQMPHGKEALSEAQIKMLKDWIDQGAVKE